MGCCRRATFFVATVLLFIGSSRSQENANPTIPERLLDCYQNASIYHRENRLSMNIRTLIDLVRKIEASPTGRNMNAKEVASSLQYFLRLDGIQVSPNTQQTADIVPFAPGGTEYYKHRLSLVKLLSKPSRDTDDFLYENLTPKEVCNLHFMLSYSIDPFKRAEEQCSAIITETGYQEGSVPPYQPNQPNPPYQPNQPNPPYQPNQPNPPYQPSYQAGGYQPYRPNPGGNRPPRSRRDAAQQTDQEVVRSMKRKVRRTLESLRNAPEEVEKEYISNKLQDVMLELRKNERRIQRDAEQVNEESMLQVDVEILPPEGLQQANDSGEDDTNADFTIGKNTMIGPGMDHSLRGGYAVADDRRISSTGKRMTPLALKPKYSVDLPLSDCPVENGVVQTPYGSVTIGTVIAGIASGLAPQQINPTELNVKPTSIKPELANVRVDNVWATTLSGNVAEMILSTGAQDTFNQAVGLKGGWNDTFNPKWYLLQNKNVKFLTDVELRGGLDGLWLGKKVTSWVQKFGQLKLSQILDMYYSTSGSGFEPTVQACNRRVYLNEYAQSQEFHDQVHIFSLVLQNQRVNEVTFKDFTNLVNTAIQNVQNYVPQLDRSCDTVNQATTSVKVDTNTNLVLVMDTTWEYTAAANVIGFLINEEVAATPYQSNLTILCGSSGNVLAVLTDTTGVQTNFTMEAYRNCTPGMTFDNIAYGTEIFYRQLYMEEKIQNTINTQTQILAFLPIGALNINGNSGVNSNDNPEETPTFKYKQMLANNFPDVRLIVATPGAKDTWTPIVKDPNLDLFTIQIPRPGDRTPTEALKAVTNSIKQTPHRLSKPKCGSYFVYEEGDATVRDNVQIGFTKYYKLEPNYFYDVGSGDGAAKVTVQGLRNSKLQVCYYRSNPVTGGTRSNNPGYYPPAITTTPSPGAYRLGWQTDGTGSGDNCKTITTDQFIVDLIDPCSGKGTISTCEPLYITVTADYDSPDSNSISANCNNCRNPTNVEYNIGVVGLSCKSSAATLFTTPLLIAVCFLLRHLNIL